MSGGFADEKRDRKIEFSVDIDGGGVSAEAAGRHSGHEPHREAVQCVGAPGGFSRARTDPCKKRNYLIAMAE